MLGVNALLPAAETGFSAANFKLFEDFEHQRSDFDSGFVITTPSKTWRIGIFRLS
jgi:hypothetical protein